jgi:hypothetical protein
MTKRLSDQPADLSVRAKGAEQALDAAEREAHDKIVARNWSAVKAKIADDVNHLKANVAHVKHEHDVKRAETKADRLEWEAGFAIDYAIAAVEQAKLAVLDAVDGRVAADEAKRA